MSLIELDSLHQAETEFIAQKYRNPLNFIAKEDIGNP